MASSEAEGPWASIDADCVCPAWRTIFNERFETYAVALEKIAPEEAKALIAAQSQRTAGAGGAGPSTPAPAKKAKKEEKAPAENKENKNKYMSSAERRHQTNETKRTALLKSDLKDDAFKERFIERFLFQKHAGTKRCSVCMAQTQAAGMHDLKLRLCATCHGKHMVGKSNATELFGLTKTDLDKLPQHNAGRMQVINKVVDVIEFFSRDLIRAGVAKHGSKAALEAALADRETKKNERKEKNAAAKSDATGTVTAELKAIPGYDFGSPYGDVLKLPARLQCELSYAMGSRASKSVLKAAKADGGPEFNKRSSRKWPLVKADLLLWSRRLPRKDKLIALLRNEEETPAAGGNKRKATGAGGASMVSAVLEWSSLMGRPPGEIALAASAAAAGGAGGGGVGGGGVGGEAGAAADNDDDDAPAGDGAGVATWVTLYRQMGAAYDAFVRGVDEEAGGEPPGSTTGGKTKAKGKGKGKGKAGAVAAKGTKSTTGQKRKAAEARGDDDGGGVGGADNDDANDGGDNDTGGGSGGAKAKTPPPLSRDDIAQAATAAAAITSLYRRAIATRAAADTRAEAASAAAAAQAAHAADVARRVTAARAARGVSLCAALATVMPQLGGHWGAETAFTDDLLAHVPTVARDFLTADDAAAAAAKKTKKDAAVPAAAAAAAAESIAALARTRLTALLEMLSGPEGVGGVPNADDGGEIAGTLAARLQLDDAEAAHFTRLMGALGFWSQHVLNLSAPVATLAAVIRPGSPRFESVSDVSPSLLADLRDFGAMGRVPLAGYTGHAAVFLTRGFLTELSRCRRLLALESKLESTKDLGAAKHATAQVAAFIAKYDDDPESAVRAFEAGVLRPRGAPSDAAAPLPGCLPATRLSISRVAQLADGCTDGPRLAIAAAYGAHLLGEAIFSKDVPQLEMVAAWPRALQQQRAWAAMEPGALAAELVAMAARAKKLSAAISPVGHLRLGDASYYTQDAFHAYVCTGAAPALVASGEPLVGEADCTYWRRGTPAYRVRISAAKDKRQEAYPPAAGVLTLQLSSSMAAIVATVTRKEALMRRRRAMVDAALRAIGGGSEAAAADPAPPLVMDLTARRPYSTSVPYLSADVLSQYSSYSTLPAAKLAAWVIKDDLFESPVSSLTEPAAVSIKERHRIAYLIKLVKQGKVAEERAKAAEVQRAARMKKSADDKAESDRRVQAINVRLSSDPGWGLGGGINCWWTKDVARRLVPEYLSFTRALKDEFTEDQVVAAMVKWVAECGEISMSVANSMIRQSTLGAMESGDYDYRGYTGEEEGYMEMFDEDMFEDFEMD